MFMGPEREPRGCGVGWCVYRLVGWFGSVLSFLFLFANHEWTEGYERRCLLEEEGLSFAL